MISTYIIGVCLSLLYACIFGLLPRPVGLGEVGVAVYFHVPCAWVGTLFLLAAAVLSLSYLLRGESALDAKAVAAARVGFVFAVLATATGAIFAHATWGVAWNWDPRQTTMVMILLIYGAYFALRANLDRAEVRARLSAAYAVLCGTALPFLVLVLPRIYPSLHPTPVIARAAERGGMDVIFLVTLLLSTLLITALAGKLWLVDWRSTYLTKERWRKTA